VFWGAQQGVDHYLVTLNCPPSADAPNEISCDSPTEYPGDTAGLLLTGLTNNHNYTVDVSGHDASGAQVLADVGDATTTDRLVFMPLLER
jgi:hypothetical protein